MRNFAIFLPVLALVAWTFVVLLLIPFSRAHGLARGDVRLDDFAHGESPRVPPAVNVPNRAYMNLLEAPVLFYVACIVLYVTTGATWVAVGLAWAYVALRVVHSLVHLTYNRVSHRGLAFAASNAVLVALWVITGMHLLAAAGTPG